jgi:hypothetical protein
MATCTVMHSGIVQLLGAGIQASRHQALYAVFTGLLPGLAAVLSESCGECMMVAMCNPGCCALFPGV